MEKKRFSPAFVLVSILLFIVLQTAEQVVSSSSRAFGQALTPQLRLHRGEFDGLTAENEWPEAPGSYAIIQFQGPIASADRQALQQTGVKILEYLPDFAYLVQGTAVQLDSAAALHQVYARVPFTLADKLAPALLEAVRRGERSIGRVRVIPWPKDTGQLAADIGALRFDPTKSLNQQQLWQIARLSGVRFIEPLTQPKILNDYARNIMGVNNVWLTVPLFGGGQTLAIADSGLDTGNMGTLSPDFAGRVVATHILATGGDWGDQHGHGTHVAGSALGAGVQSGSNPGADDYINSFAGMAPEASLVVQGFEADPITGEITGIPADYYQLFDQAYTSGARVHSDSWGDVTGPITDTAASFGGYPYGAQRTDEFIWDHPDMSIFSAAGNSGKDGTPGILGLCTDGNGVVDPDSLLSPGTAKNVITVGASESDKDEGPLQGAIWFLLNFCFATNPIASDLIANNIDGMAAFSSRGPTDDGRSKPDIVAPGTNIVSNRSHDPTAGTLWGAYDANYSYSGGTSMATPLTAGMGLLVREWLTGQGAPNPSAALLKAVLLNTTQDMAPGQYGTGSTQEIPYQQPNSVAGWGRANLGFVDPPLDYGLWFDDHSAGLNTGQSVTYTHSITQPLQVVTDTQPLRFMLVWTDPPASLSASAQLVNDLDLVVTGPGGTYYGNEVMTGDRLNNVEGIIIDAPPVGDYQVSISAFNVPTATQPFALVVAGPLGGGPPPPPDPTLFADDYTVEAGSDVTVTVAVTDVLAPGLGAATIQVNYDPAVLSIVGCTADPDSLFDVEICNPTYAPDALRFTLTSFSGVSGAFPLADISFTAIGAVDDVSPLAIQIVAFADPVGAPLSATIQDGTVTITGIAGDVSCDNSRDVIDALYIMQYDVGMRSAVSSCPLPPDTLNVSVCDVSGDAACNVIDALYIMQCEVGITNPLCPPIIGGGESWQSPPEKGAIPLPLAVGLPAAYGQTGVSLTAAIVASAPEGTTVGAITLAIEYDPQLLRVESCGTAAAPYFSQCQISDEAPGLTRLTFMAPLGAGGEFEVGQITLTPLLPGTHELILSASVAADANGQVLPVELINGVLYVDSRPASIR